MTETETSRHTEGGRQREGERKTDRWDDMYMQRHMDVITHPSPLSTIKELIHPLRQTYKYTDTLRMHRKENKVFDDKNVLCCIINPYLKRVVTANPC